MLTSKNENRKRPICESVRLSFHFQSNYSEVFQLELVVNFYFLNLGHGQLRNCRTEDYALFRTWRLQAPSSKLELLYLLGLFAYCINVGRIMILFWYL